MCIQSFIHFSREKRSNNAQSSPSFFHTLEALRDLPASHPWLIPVLSPGCLTATMDGQVGDVQTVGRTMSGLGVPGSVYRDIYQEVYTHHGTGSTIHQVHLSPRVHLHPGYTSHTPGTPLLPTGVAWTPPYSTGVAWTPPYPRVYTTPGIPKGVYHTCHGGYTPRIHPIREATHPVYTPRRIYTRYTHPGRIYTRNTHPGRLVYPAIPTREASIPGYTHQGGIYTRFTHPGRHIHRFTHPGRLYYPGIPYRHPFTVGRHLQPLPL